MVTLVPKLKSAEWGTSTSTVVSTEYEPSLVPPVRLKAPFGLQNLSSVGTGPVKTPSLPLPVASIALPLKG